MLFASAAVWGMMPNDGNDQQAGNHVDMIQQHQNDTVSNVDDCILRAVEANNIQAIKRVANESLRNILVSKLMRKWNEQEKEKREEYWFLDYLFQNRIESVNLRNNEGNTPLHIAIQNKNVKMVELLVKLGANVNIANHHGYTPLMLAGENVMNTYTEFRVFGYSDNGDFKKIVEYLVMNGANINEKDPCGKTLLIKATSKGEVPVVKWLVELGADSTKINEYGDNLLFFVIKNHCAGHSYDIIKSLIEDLKTDINQKNKDEDTPLLFMTRERYNEISMTYFIEQGADLNIKDKYGNTVLMNYLIKEEYPEESFVKFLIEHGADIYSKNVEGETPFSYVKEYYSPCLGLNPEVEKYRDKLESNGAFWGNVEWATRELEHEKAKEIKKEKAETLISLFKEAAKDLRSAEARERAKRDPKALAKREARARFREAARSIDYEENLKLATEMYESEEKSVRSASAMQRALDRRTRREEAEAEAKYDSSVRAASQMMKNVKIVAPKRKTTNVIKKRKFMSYY